MKLLGLAAVVLGTLATGVLHASTVIVATPGPITILFGASETVVEDALGMPPTSLSGGGWSLNFQILTNLVAAGGGLATADGALNFRFTDALLTCTDISGCGPISLVVAWRFDILNPSVLEPTFNYGLTGTGPDFRLQVQLYNKTPIADTILSGPSYSYSGSDGMPPAGNFGFRVSFRMNAASQGTTLSLPDSFDISMPATTPEPATLPLMGGALGLVAWRVRRRRVSY